jgi:hypothetical protein
LIGDSSALAPDVTNAPSHNKIAAQAASNW